MFVLLLYRNMLDTTVMSQFGEYKNMVDGLKNEVRTWKTRYEEFNDRMIKFDQTHKDTFATTQHVEGMQQYSDSKILRT